MDEVAGLRDVTSASFALSREGPSDPFTFDPPSRISLATLSRRPVTVLRTSVAYVTRFGVFARDAKVESPSAELEIPDLALFAVETILPVVTPLVRRYMRFALLGTARDEVSPWTSVSI